MLKNAVNRKVINTLIFNKHRDLNMSSILGALFGGTSISAVMLGAFKVPLESASSTLFVSLLGGVILSLCAYVLDNKNRVSE